MVPLTSALSNLRTQKHTTNIKLSEYPLSILLFETTFYNWVQSASQFPEVYCGPCPVFSSTSDTQNLVTKTFMCFDKYSGFNIMHRQKRRECSAEQTIRPSAPKSHRRDEKKQLLRGRRFIFDARNNSDGNAFPVSGY